MPDIRDLKRIEKALLEVQRRKVEDKLSFYQPYIKQQAFHDMGLTKRERAFFANNQGGKTYAGAAETAMHLTGKYPDWWLGRRFDRPVTCWVAGVTSESTRETCQRLLMGSVAEVMTYGPGRGMIPKDCIDMKMLSTARGVSGVYDTAVVKHISGGVSQLEFKSYERGREKWQGATLDFIWFDEEPDMDIYQEGLARISATNGMVFMTFTPLKGMKQVVPRFWKEKHEDRGFVRMEMEEALHISAAERQRNIDAYLPHEREARVKGIPLFGSGKIFTALESNIVVSPFAPPRHWRYIWGVDFGIDHPFAAVLMGMDMDNDCLYIMSCVKMADATPLQHCAAMKPRLQGRGDKVPLAWPQDGWQRKEFEGALEPTAMIYKKQHKMNVLHTHAQFEDGSNSTWAGILEMRERFGSGRLKVFSDQTEWLDEYRSYHMDEGKIYKKDDDLMSASRVAVMAKRFAKSVLWAPQSQDGRGVNEGMAAGVDCDPWL